MLGLYFLSRLVKGRSEVGCVTIGEGAMIGAGAVVTKDVKDFDMVAGVPARVIGKTPKEHRRL